MAQKDQNGGSEKMEFNIRAFVNMYRIRLTVKNVSKVTEETKVISPDFYLTPECLANISFKKNSNNLWVYISNKSDNKIKVERTIALSDCNNKILHEEREGKIFSLKKGEEADVIGQVTNRNRYDTLANDMLIIDLCVGIKGTEGKEITSSLEYDTESTRKLKDDLKTMLENPVNSDVCLQVGEDRIPAHWSILCSRSSCFKRMFDSQMKERVQNCIKITDLSLATVKKLIQFLYIADFVEEDDLQELLDLYYAADKYEMMDLRTSCARNIVNNTTVENVSRILRLAHRHNDKDLKKQAMRFIQLHSDAVFQTDGWKEFEANEPLAAEIFSFWLKKN